MLIHYLIRMSHPQVIIRALQWAQGSQLLNNKG